MTLEANRTLVEEIWRAIVEQDWASLEAAYHPDAVYHGPGPTEIAGRDGIISLTKSYRTAFPDLGFEILDCVADGDMVATRGRGTGTQLGPLQDLAPTGRRVLLEIMHFMRIADGRVAEEWEVFDQLDFLRQLGVAPPGG